MQKMRWLVDFATPALGSRPIADITTLEILDVLRKVEVRGRYETAIRLRGTIGAILRFAVITGRAARDITVELHGALPLNEIIMRRQSLVEAWRRSTKVDRRRFERLKRAYVEARYSPNYKVSIENLDALYASVKRLRDRVARLGEARIAELSRR